MPNAASEAPPGINPVEGVEGGGGAVCKGCSAAATAAHRVPNKSWRRRRFVVMPANHSATTASAAPAAARAARTRSTKPGTAWLHTLMRSYGSCSAQCHQGVCGKLPAGEPAALYADVSAADGQEAWPQMVQSSACALSPSTPPPPPTSHPPPGSKADRPANYQTTSCRIVQRPPVQILRGEPGGGGSRGGTATSMSRVRSKLVARAAPLPPQAPHSAQHPHPRSCRWLARTLSLCGSSNCWWRCVIIGFPLPNPG